MRTLHDRRMNLNILNRIAEAHKVIELNCANKRLSPFTFRMIFTRCEFGKQSFKRADKLIIQKRQK